MPSVPKCTRLRIAHARTCYWCGARLKRRGMRQRTVDHLVPRSRGGTNARENTVAACHACNQTRNLFGHCPGALACWLTVLCLPPPSRILRNA
jgi:hypothetical protein